MTGLEVEFGDLGQIFGHPADPQQQALERRSADARAAR